MKHLKSALLATLFSVAAPLASSAVLINETLSSRTLTTQTYLGSKVSITNGGTGGSTDGQVEILFDGNGHGAYVFEMKLPSTAQKKTIYLSYNLKVNPADAYMTWRPKHLKFRGFSPDKSCYWNTTVFWDEILYGGGSCERDATNGIKPKDATANSRTGPVTIVKQPDSTFYFTSNKWYNWTVMVTANDLGAKNGELKFWIDGKLYWHIKGVEFRSSSQNWYINQIDFGGYTGGNPGTPAKLYLDDIKVSDSPLTGETPAEIAAPQPPILRIQ